MEKARDNQKKQRLRKRSKRGSGKTGSTDSGATATARRPQRKARRGGAQKEATSAPATSRRAGLGQGANRNAGADKTTDKRRPHTTRLKEPVQSAPPERKKTPSQETGVNLSPGGPGGGRRKTPLRKRGTDRESRTGGERETLDGTSGDGNSPLPKARRKTRKRETEDTSGRVDASIDAGSNPIAGDDQDSRPKRRKPNLDDRRGGDQSAEVDPEGEGLTARVGAEAEVDDPDQRKRRVKPNQEGQEAELEDEADDEGAAVAAASGGGGDEDPDRRRGGTGPGDPDDSGSDDESSDDDDDEGGENRGGAATPRRRRRRRANNGEPDSREISREDLAAIDELERDGFDINGNDVNDLKDEVEKIRTDGVNWQRAMELFQNDPDFQDIFEGRMKRQVDPENKNEKKGLFSRMFASVKKDFFTGRNLVLAAVSALPVANFLKPLADRSSEKGRKRFNRVIADLGPNATTQGVTKPLYAARRQEQTKATIGAVIGGISTAQTVVGLAGPTTSLGALGGKAMEPIAQGLYTKMGSGFAGAAAQLGATQAAKTGAGLVETGIKKGLAKGGLLAEEAGQKGVHAVADKVGKANQFDKGKFNVEGAERTRAFLEFLGMKSRLPLMREQKETLGPRLSKEQVKQEMLRLEIRRSLGMKDDDADLMDREGYMKDRTTLGSVTEKVRLPKSIRNKVVEKREYLEPGELAVYRKLKKTRKKTKPREKVSAEEAERLNANTKKLTDEIKGANILAMLFKSEGLFKDGTNRLRETKGYRRVLDDELQTKYDVRSKVQKLDKEKEQLKADLGTDASFSSLKKTAKSYFPGQERTDEEKLAIQQKRQRLRDIETERTALKKTDSPSKRIEREKGQVSHLKQELKELRKQDGSNTDAITAKQTEIRDAEIRVAELQKDRSETKRRYAFPKTRGNELGNLFKT